jgi:hypothetical protein
MRIRHDENGDVYEIIEVKGSFKLLDLSNNRSYIFKEAYEAIWMAIEIIRNSTIESLAEEHLSTITRRAKLDKHATPKSLLASIKREKIIRTYYDQIFLKILSQYRSGHETVVVSNKTNFVVDHEVGFLLRKSLGINLTIPDYSA